jgi:proteasome activator subunit 4
MFLYYRERKADCVWHFNPPESYRITEIDITDFVNCVKECAFISVFNKAHFEEAAKACQCLSQLRPELIVPPLVELFVFFHNYYYLFIDFIFLDSSLPSIA